MSYKNNVSGKYYVGEECIGCTLCAEIAPDNFKINTDESLPMAHGYVFRQPGNSEDETLCEEAMDNCPASAISNDG
ncbi:ferredoxin [Desulfococcaceae bacterium HSG8]|nr:ferredoxin [Desulfococcaceae bacterium HSG8]